MQQMGGGMGDDMCSQMMAQMKSNPEMAAKMVDMMLSDPEMSQMIKDKVGSMAFKDSVVKARGSRMPMDMQEGQMMK